MSSRTSRSPLSACASPGRELEEYEAQDERARKKRKAVGGPIRPEAPNRSAYSCGRCSCSPRPPGDGAKQARLDSTAFSKRRQLLARASQKMSMILRLAPGDPGGRTDPRVHPDGGGCRRSHAASAAGWHPGQRPARRTRPDRAERRLRPLPGWRLRPDRRPDAPRRGGGRPRRRLGHRRGEQPVALAYGPADGAHRPSEGRWRDGPDSRSSTSRGTSEDPTNGAHEDFIQFVIDAADETRRFLGGRGHEGRQPVPGGSMNARLA